jgi:ribosomal-protein-alanine N-acetyltransferase
VTPAGPGPEPAPGTLVRLRRPAPADYPRLFDWYNDPEIVAPFDRFELDTWESFTHDLAAAPEDPASTAPRFVIERILDRQLLGLLGHYRAHPVLTLTDVWYVLGDRAERGKGYGAESVRLLVSHLFRTEPLPRVGATCDVENVPSRRLLERLGFRHEGTLTRALFHHGGWHDVRVYGVTREEWAARAAPDGS